MCEITDRIRREGEEAGRIKGMIEATLELLEDLGKVPQQVAQHIRQESDMNVLSRWLKCAARSSSIAEFETNM